MIIKKYMMTSYSNPNMRRKAKTRKKKHIRKGTHNKEKVYDKWMFTIKV